MPETSDRFECFMDPADLWLVWDNELDAPAEYAGVVLYGLDKDEAESLAQMLNQLPPPID